MRRLLIRPGAIGDCIVSLPALEYLRADYTEVWAASANLPLIRFADRARSIASTGLDLLELGQAQQARASYQKALELAQTIEPEFQIRSVPDIEQKLQSVASEGQ